MDGVPAVIEAPASVADVEIAQIEADRDIALAEIHTESNEAQTEAVLEAQADDGKDVEWLITELAGLRASQETHAGNLSEHEGRLTAMEHQIAEMSGLLAGLILANPPTPSPPSGEGTGEEIPSGEEGTGQEENTGQEAPPRDQTPKTPARRPIVRM